MACDVNLVISINPKPRVYNRAHSALSGISSQGVTTQDTSEAVKGPQRSVIKGNILMENPPGTPSRLWEISHILIKISCDQLAGHVISAPGVDLIFGGNAASGVDTVYSILRKRCTLPKLSRSFSMVYAAQAAIQHTTYPWCTLSQAAMMFNFKKLRLVHAAQAAKWYCISFFYAPARRLDCRAKLSLFTHNSFTWCLPPCK